MANKRSIEVSCLGTSIPVKAKPGLVVVVVGASVVVVVGAIVVVVVTTSVTRFWTPFVMACLLASLFIRFGT